MKCALSTLLCLALLTDLASAQETKKPSRPTGRVEVVIPDARLAPLVQDLLVHVQGPGGSRLMPLLSESVELAAGVYFVTNVQVILKDPKSGLRWSYAFGPLKAGRKLRHHRLEPGQTLQLAPLEGLTFEMKASSTGRRLRRGQTIGVGLSLGTADGLSLLSSSHGAISGYERPLFASVALLDESSAEVGSAQSGFS